MSGWHPASAGSDEFLRFFLLALLIIVATVFEIISHSITHKLQHEAHDHSGHDDGHEVKPNIFKAQLSLKLWTRAQSELTVLGFLACCIWFANRAQLLEVGVGWGSTLFMGESAGVPAAEHGHHLRFLEAAHHEDPAAHHDDDFAAHGPVWTMDGYCWPGSLRWLPPSGEALVHILEDVHMTLFLTMVAYFFCMQLSLNLLVGTLERFQKEERLMSDASSAAPSPPASPTALMIESIRTRLVGFYLGDEDLDGQVDEAELEHRLKMLTKEQADLVREIHKTVTVTTVVTIDKPDACAKPSPKASSPGAVAGGGVRFNVSSFLMQLMREDVEELIQFDTSAWSVVMSYSVLCLGLARVSCFSDTSALAVGFGIDLIWLTASLYAAARVAVHAARLARPVGVHGCCGQQLWPAIGLDRLCFPLQFGVVGSFPWRAGVSEEAALNCFQAMLFFQLYSVTESAIVLAFGTADSAPYNLLITSYIPGSHGMVVILSLKAALVGLWATFILPRLIVAFALPPFVTKKDEQKLFEKLKHTIRRTAAPPITPPSKCATFTGTGTGTGSGSRGSVSQMAGYFSSKAEEAKKAKRESVLI